MYLLEKGSEGFVYPMDWEYPNTCLWHRGVSEVILGDDDGLKAYFLCFGNALLDA